MQEYLIALGLDPNKKDYTPKDYKKAWIKKAQEHHPDKGGDAEEFKKVMHAYMMLTDPSYIIQEEAKKYGNARKKEELDIRFSLPVTFEEAFFGKKLLVNYGFGKVNGIGDRITEKSESGEEIFGLVTHTIPINIPAGAFDGGEIGYRGKGIVQVTDQGEMAGDAVFMIQVLPHPKFRYDRNKNAIVSEEYIPLNIMLKGGEYECLTMHGLKTLRVKPGTMPKATIGIRGAGFQGGDHLVTVDFKYPTKEELKNDPAWKDFNIKWDEEEARSQDQSITEDLVNTFIKIQKQGLRF